jgi:hypothetical protein
VKIQAQQLSMNVQPQTLVGILKNIKMVQLLRKKLKLVLDVLRQKVGKYYMKIILLNDMNFNS